MTDLQLGLLVIGGLAVAGVLAYNRLQERSARAEAQRAFDGSRHADALLEEPGGRTEPTLEASPAAKPVVAQRTDTAAPAVPDLLPDERVDYIVDLELSRPAGAPVVLEHWAPIERRFARRVLLAASNDDGWHRLRAGDTGPCRALRAGLQLVTRAGVTAEAEVLEFRAEVEAAGAKLGAAMSAPEMREALEAARELDAVCADADIQVALHVAGAQVPDDALASYAGQPFALVRQGDDIVLTLDVPRAPELGRSYEAMVRAARHLAGNTGRLVDDRGRVLDDRALVAIGGQLEPARAALAARGIETGTPLALRLFS